MTDLSRDPESEPLRRAGVVLATILSLLGVVYLVRQRSVLADLAQWRPVFLVPLLLSELCALSLRGVLLRELCQRFDVRLGVFESMTVAAWTTLANYVAPLLGGASLKAVYLRHRHAMRYADFLSLHSSVLVAQLGIAAGLGILAIQVQSGLPSEAQRLLTPALLVTIAASLFFFACPVDWLAEKSWLGRRLRRLAAGLVRVRSARLWLISALIVANAAAVAGALYSAFSVVGVGLMPAQALLLAVSSQLSLVISVTSAGLGITESVVVAVSALLSVPPPLSLAAAAIRRISSIAGASLLSALGAVRRGNLA